MTVQDRRARERAARRQLITTTARRLAEAEGWDAVTTRRLSTEIEYSQPVLYKHFSNMEKVVESVAVEGFGELAEALSTARKGLRASRKALLRVAHAFIRFAHDSPALYDAMFIRATTLRFADPDSPPELIAAFAELREAVSAVAGTRDTDTLTEVLWAALHGLVTLDRNGRLRPDCQSGRVDLLVAEFADGPAAPR
jgi:AcrR family transcriptional regulator